MIDFELLVHQLESRLKQPLPGPPAHEIMRAISVGSTVPKFAHKDPPKPGSVLIVLYPDADRILLPLIKRPDYNGLHSGQVSFPGGKAEAGETDIETALREGNEEIGISINSINVIGKLTNFYVIPSNFIVTPIVAYTTSKPALKPDPVEVAKIIHCDIEAILPDSAVLEKEITVSNLYQLKAPHFQIENEVVWGATAMMLNELRLILKESTVSNG